jgi:hypothetical protein
MSDDLRVYAGDANAEDWDKVPFPAKQQLGFHGDLPVGRDGTSINDHTGKGPEELLGSVDLSERTADTATLLEPVTYFLDPPPVVVPYSNPWDAPTDVNPEPTADEASVEEPPGPLEVPHGPIDRVLAWVGDDKDRAARALEVEQAKAEPRASLVARLSAL